MQLTADMHIHSLHSVDGTSDLDEMCQAAINKGLKYVCFTEHFDLNPNDIGYEFYDYQRVSEDIERVRDRYGEQLTVLKGLEFGEPHLYQREFEEIQKLDFDVIMAGIHWVGEDSLADADLPQRYSLGDIFACYYEEVLRAVEFGGFDVLAHLDLPKRYLKETDETCDLLDEILKKLASSGIALEINTSPLRRGLDECCPGPSLLDRFLSFGGKRVTVGSDAHYPSDIAANFAEAAAAISKAGIPTAGIVQKRRFAPLLA